MIFVDSMTKSGEVIFDIHPLVCGLWKWLNCRNVPQTKVFHNNNKSNSLRTLSQAESAFIASTYTWVPAEQKKMINHQCLSIRMTSNTNQSSSHNNSISLKALYSIYSSSSSDLHFMLLPRFHILCICCRKYFLSPFYSLAQHKWKDELIKCKRYSIPYLSIVCQSNPIKFTPKCEHSNIINQFFGADERFN